MALRAVAVSAFMFWGAHLNHANGVPRIVSLCLMGATFGVLTVCARSILPAMCIHATADSIVFTAAVVSGGVGFVFLRRLARTTSEAVSAAEIP